MTSKSPKPDMSDEIDANLRKVYEKALNEELPAKFLTLLDRLKSGETPGGSDPSDRGDA